MGPWLWSLFPFWVFQAFSALNEGGTIGMSQMGLVLPPEEAFDDFRQWTQASFWIQWSCWLERVSCFGNAEGTTEILFEVAQESGWPQGKVIPSSRRAVLHAH